MPKKDPNPATPPSANPLARALLAVSILCLGLIVAVAWLLFSRGPSVLPLLEAQNDPKLRQQVVDELIQQGTGLFDAFPDPDVGAILQPNLKDRATRDFRVSSNRFGMRERDYEIPKPQGTVRIVLVGDSFIYGSGVAAQERCGAFLERFLKERGVPSVECLHIALEGWNILSASHYTLRQLDLLQPDLVIQFAVPNDLDDTAAVRGFGSLAGFSTQHAPGSLIQRNWCTRLGAKSQGYLLYGADYESQARYAAAARSMERLARATSNYGRYLLVLNWMKFLPVGRERLTPGLKGDQVALMPFSFYNDPRYRISEADGHWNVQGHERVAQLLYGLIQLRGLLPGVSLPSWDVATSAVEQLHVAGMAEARRSASVRDLLGDEELLAELDLADLSPKAAAQVHGGMFYHGLAAPYASMVLARSGNRLKLAFAGLDGVSTLPDLQVQVYVDEFPVGTLRPETNNEATVTWDLPTEVRSRSHVSLRLRSSDYVYSGPELRNLICFRLLNAAIVP